MTQNLQLRLVFIDLFSQQARNDIMWEKMDHSVILMGKNMLQNSSLEQYIYCNIFSAMNELA